MAKIPLRTYLQEIERLVDSQRIDEAVAHSRHILQLYPKYVDIYRVLGKAYLEAKRYGDAADIFQRVLSSLPEDFVANAGMSIIREDEGNLDESIWHMERAFEIEPSNSTIQDELRRLIGKRDGLEPPRIRLTRGALARMYMKGDLIQEAITEIRIALTEDANRLDLRALLAVALHRVGQRVEAIEAANQVLRKLPNNLDANRIMAELLAGTERDEEAQEYRKVVIELDPYFSFVTPSTPIAAQVPSQAVSIEKLDWKAPVVPAEVAETPGWAAGPGIQAAETSEPEEVVPAWLSTRQEVFGQADSAAMESDLPAPAEPGAEDNLEIASAETVPQPAEISSQPQEEIPDWMLAAGWIPISAGVVSLEESQESAVPDQEETAGEELEPAAPVWLAANLPESETLAEPEAADTGTEEALPEWVFEQEPAFSAENELPPWLSESTVEPTSGASSEANAQPGATEGLPEWLFVEEAPATEKPVPDTEIPAWLMEDAGAATSSVDAEPVIDESAEVPIPAWLFEAAAPEEVVQPEEEAKFPALAAAALGGVIAMRQATEDAPGESPEPVLPAEEVPPTVEADLTPTTIPTEPSAPSETPPAKAATTLKLPAWLLVSREVEKSPPASEEVSAPEAELTEPSLDEAEHLVIPPLDEKESFPAWLLDEDLQIPEQPIEENVQQVEGVSGGDEIPEWLTMLAEPPVEEEDTKPRKVEQAVEFSALSDAVVPETSFAESTDENALPPAWLLAALTAHEVKESQPEPMEELPEVDAEEVETQPATDQIAGAIPEWLLAEELQTTETPEESAAILVETGEAAPAIPVMPGETEAADLETSQPVSEMEELAPETVLRAEIMAQEMLEESEGAEKPLEMVEEIQEEIPTEISSEEMPEWLVTPVEDKASIFDWTPPPVAPSEYVNLNSASLVELERLPGMGFIRAQNIVNYREHNGPFTDLEELEKVPGLTSDIISNLKDYVYIEKTEASLPQEEEPAEKLEAGDVMPQALLTARSALLQDEIDPALADYAKFIESYQFLPEIIQDLKDAVSRHPDNPDLWLSLGDAYIRSNQVQSALDSYRRAEKLLI